MKRKIDFSLKINIVQFEVILFDDNRNIYAGSMEKKENIGFYEMLPAAQTGPEWKKLLRGISYFSVGVNPNIMSSSLPRRTDKDNATRITGDIL